MAEDLVDAFDAACMGFRMVTPETSKRRRGNDSPPVATAAGQDSRDMSPPCRNVERRGVSCGDTTNVASVVEMPAPLQNMADTNRVEGLTTPPRQIVHRFIGPQKICHDTEHIVQRTMQSFAPDYHQLIWCYKSSPAFPKISALKIAHLETCLLYTSPSPRDGLLSRMPSSA